jgi:hypothetical protein
MAELKSQLIDEQNQQKEIKVSDIFVDKSISVKIFLVLAVILSFL